MNDRRSGFQPTRGQQAAIRRAALACIAGAIVQAGPQAFAAEPAAGARPMEETIVSARRRDEKLQDVPATVSVLTDETIFLTGDDSMEQLRDTIPNFNFASDLAYRSRVSVRGLGSDRSGAQTNGVGFFIDGVYQNGTARFNAPFFDVERLEVLKGPQGARYGRNAFAGVVNVVTKKPSDELRFNAQMAQENHGGNEYAVSFSGALIPGQLYGKVSGAHNETDGDYQHQVTGEDMQALESDFMSARLVWAPTDDLEFDLNWTKMDNDGVAFAFSQTRSLQDLSETYVLDDGQTSGADYTDWNLGTVWSFDGFEIQNKLAYYDYLNHLDVDGDVQPFRGIRSVVELEGDQWSNEFRLQSNGTGPFRWMAGFEIVHGEFDANFPTFFLDEIDFALTGARNLPLRDFLVSISPSTNTIEGESDVWSVFGELSYLFSESLELTVSARYDDIEKEVFNSSAGPAGGGGLGAEFEDEALQPLVSLRYTVDDYTSVYASAAKGIREGGFNASALTKEYGLFDSDEVWSYEAGVKMIMPDLGARLNVSVFYADAEVLNQAAIIVTDAGSLANGAITLGGADTWGIELDGSIAVNDWLTWNFAAGYLDCELKDVPPFAERSPDFRQVSPGVLDGNSCQDSSQYSFNSSFALDYPIGDSGWQAIGSLTFSGKGDTRLTSDALLRGKESLQEEVYLVDLTAGARSEHWTVLGYVENATNQRYALDHFSAQGLIDSGLGGAVDFITTLAPRRHFGVKVRYDL